MWSILKNAGRKAVLFTIGNKDPVFVILAQLENRRCARTQHLKVFLVQIRPIALTPFVPQLQNPHFNKILHKRCYRAPRKSQLSRNVGDVRDWMPLDELEQTKPVCKTPAQLSSNPCL